jgi:hypothetical protein
MDQGVVVWVSGPSDDTTARVAAAVTERMARRHLPTELLTVRTDGIAALAGDDMARRVAFVAARPRRRRVVV